MVAEPLSVMLGQLMQGLEGEVRADVFDGAVYRVTLGVEGVRKRSELNILRSRVVLRIRWKIIGPPMASAPRRNRGARKLMLAKDDDTGPGAWKNVFFAFVRARNRTAPIRADVA